MRPVKCRKCGTKLDKEIAYKVVVGDKNTYYCNQKEYEDMLQEREDRDFIYKSIEEIFGHKTKNTSLYKEMNSLFDIYGISIVKNYIDQKKENLISIMQSKDFQSEYGKIRYFSAILKNHLTDFKVNISEKEKEVFTKTYDNEEIKEKFKRKKKRKSLEEIENNILEDGD